MWYLFLYLGLSIAIFVIFQKKYKFQFNEKSLDKQPLFWLSLGFPFFSFLYWGTPVWLDYQFNISADAYDKFLTISKLPLGILALSPILATFIAHSHRTFQTQKQIEAAQEKNDFDRSHVYIDAKLNFLEKLRTYSDEKIADTVSLYFEFYTKDHKIKEENTINFINSLNDKIQEFENHILPIGNTPITSYESHDLLTHSLNIHKIITMIKSMTGIELNKQLARETYFEVKLNLLHTLNNNKKRPSLDNEIKEYLDCFTDIRSILITTNTILLILEIDKENKINDTIKAIRTKITDQVKLAQQCQ